MVQFLEFEKCVREKMFDEQFLPLQQIIFLGNKGFMLLRIAVVVFVSSAKFTIVLATRRGKVIK